MKSTRSRERRIRILLILFMLGLTVSGLTAIPARSETQVLSQWFGSGTWFGAIFPEVAVWVDRIFDAVQHAYVQYPFLAYPNDWLAFGHIVIAIAFIGPLRDPTRNIWVVELGIIACLLVIPWALLFGLLRGIPWFWTLLDMSFGIVGIIPLWFARRDILALSSG